ISEYECTESEEVADGKSVTGAVIRRTLPNLRFGTPLVSSFPEITLLYFPLKIICPDEDTA
ncbi:MAG: hypothetical protein V2I97_12200, partial [Desulfococcaceae bacterium]|nr:hypothetical protein [Desulfococcaceae bacterium]